MLVAQQLTDQHDTSTFTSGELSLDEWLRTQALPSQHKGTGRVYVLTDDADPTGRVLAYYTLSTHLIERQDLTRKLGRGMPAQLPAVLLGKLAVDASAQGRGLGGRVLAEAITRVVALAEQVGFRYLIVDALHERAAAFYEHYGFKRVPTDTSLRLVLRIRPTLLGP